jgi:hypothetical protein
LSAYPDPELSRAVLIGASTFDRSDQLPNLPAVHNNLVDLRAVLTNPITGIFAENHCVVVEAPGTPADAVRPLSLLARQAEDLLLIYYSGHGVQHPMRDELYLAVGGTDENILSASAVAFETVRDAVENSRARTKLLILDCCYSGLAVGAMSVATLSPREVRIEGTSVIASSPRNKISYAPPGERYTAFSAELIRLLKDGPSIGGVPLTVQALFSGLLAAMANRNMPSPQMSSGNTSGELLLRKPPPPIIDVRLPRHTIPKSRPKRIPQSMPERIPPAISTPVLKPIPKPAATSAATSAATPNPGPTQVSNSLSASAAPLGPVAVPFERPRVSLADQPTVPARAPVTREPAGAAVRSTVIAQPKVSRVGLFLLWVGFLFFADFSLGGFVGFTFGRLPDGVRSSGDLSVGIVMLVFAVGLGVIVRWRTARRRALGSAAKVSALPRVPSWLSLSLLIVISVFCVAMIATGIALWNQDTTPAGQPSDSSLSTMAVQVMALLWFVEAGFVSVLAVVRRFTADRPGRRRR